jgi:hypothetical protein
MATTQSFGRSLTAATAIVAVPRTGIGVLGRNSFSDQSVDYYRVQVRGSTARSLLSPNALGYDPRSNLYFWRSGTVPFRRNTVFLNAGDDYRVIRGLGKGSNTLFLSVLTRPFDRRGSFFYDSQFRQHLRTTSLVIKINEGNGRQFFY